MKQRKSVYPIEFKAMTIKDVQRTWEKNEQSRRFLTKVGKYKDKPEVKNTITEVNSRLDKRQEQDP